MTSYSNQLGFDGPHIVVFTGAYGAGKSYQIKNHHWTVNLEHDPHALFSGVLSSDAIKRVYMVMIPGATNDQVHVEGVCQLLDTEDGFPEQIDPVIEYEVEICQLPPEEFWDNEICQLAPGTPDGFYEQ